MPIIPLLIAISLLILAVGVFSVWARESTKQKLQDFFVSAWIRIADYDSAALVKKPLNVISSVADRFCGTEINSRKATARISIVTLLLTTVCLLSLWPATGEPFGITDSPVQEFIESAQDFERLALKTEGKTPEEIEKSKAAWQDAQRRWPFNFYLYLARPGNGVVHGTLMLLASVFVAWAVSLFCWSYARYVLRRMLAAGDVWSLCANFCLNIFVVLFVTILGSGLLAFVVYPSARLLYMAAPAFSLGTQLAGHVLLPLITLYLAAPWFQMVIGVCLLPTIVIGALLLFAAIGQAWRKPVHRFVNVVFLRVAEFRSGPMEWVYRFLAILAGGLATVKLIKEWVTKQ